MAHLVFIPSPGTGHLFSAVELAKLLVDRDHRLTVSILVMTFPLPLGSKTQSRHTSGSQHQISYVDLSHDGFAPATTKSSAMGFSSFIDFHKPQIRDFLAESTRSNSTPLAAVVLDMFCVTMKDVADEINLPTYIFFSSGAGFLCLAFHALHQDLTQFQESNAESELLIPGFINSVPTKALPTALTDADWSKLFLSLAPKFKQSKGILVNTFLELQSHAIAYLSEDETVPPIYPVGPILTFAAGDSGRSDSIVSWLDRQPQSSVVFLCFGSMGCFDSDQAMEIAHALEMTGARFLWSLRQPPPKGQPGFPKEYEDLSEALPKGFLEKTAKTGKVIGWAPQAAVLSHPALGGFISHCGWNSALESIWFGVPVATWPLGAEQQSNAFELVKEAGIVVELKMDYRKNPGEEANYLVTAEEVANAIQQLMEVNKSYDSLIKQKVEDLSKKSRMAVAKGGSSYEYVDRFIKDVIGETEKK